MCFSGNRRKWARSGSVDHGGEGEGGGALGSGCKYISRGWHHCISCLIAGNHFFLCKIENSILEHKINRYM